jgi:hypothetical protein
MINLSRISVSVIIAGFIIILALGCSGSSPIVPLPDSSLTASSVDQNHDATHLWGYWTVTIEPLSGSVEIIPLRGAEFSVNVTTFLQPPAGKIANLGIQVTDTSEWLSEGKLKVDVKLTHPFPGLDQYTGHDVRGIFIAPGDTTASFNPSLHFTSIKEDSFPKLLNADGLTRWWNPDEFTGGAPIFSYIPGKLGTPGTFNANINPYKYFAYNLGTDESVSDYFAIPANITSRGQFYAGSAQHRLYYLQFPLVGGVPKLTFQYAVVASWVEPVDLNPNDIPGSFPLEANAFEPVNLSVTDNSTLYYTGTQSGGDIKLDLGIYAWPESAGASLLERITKIVIDTQDAITPTGYTVFDSSYIAANSSPGPAANSSIVSIEIPGVTPHSFEDQEILITIETDSDYSNSGAGTAYPSDPLAGYFMHYTPVSDQSAVITVDSIDPDHANQHTVVNDAIITGINFSSIASVRLEKGASVVNATTFAVDSTTQITASFDLASADYGLYDVVVENTATLTGKLLEGFEVILQCGTTAPMLDDVYTLDKWINTNWVATVLTAGPYKGYTIFPECNVFTGGYKVFDPMTQADGTPTTAWPAFGAYGNALVMESANSNGLMMINPAFAFSLWQVMNQTSGATVQNLSIGHNYETCGDFDGNDDFWSIGVQDISPNVYDYYLQHYTYNSGNPSAPYSFKEEWNVSPLFRDDVGGGMMWEVFGDLVMTPDAHYCYVLTGYQSGDDHKVDKVDLTGASPTIVATHSFAGEGLDTDAQINIGQSRSVKMELDNSNPDYLPCRLVVAGNKYSGGQWYMNLYRFDADLNLIDSSSKPFSLSPSTAQKFYGFGIDMDNKILVHMSEFAWSGSTTCYGVSPLPPDW